MKNEREEFMRSIRMDILKETEGKLSMEWIEKWLLKVWDAARSVKNEEVVEWHKILALVMAELGLENVIVERSTITKIVEDSQRSLATVGYPATTVVARELPDGQGIHVMLVPWAQAKLAFQSGPKGGMN